MSRQDFEGKPERDEELAEEDIAFNDKRRFNDRGERVKVEVRDGNAKGSDGEEEVQKSPEVARLEAALKETLLRCEAAEGKLIEVQKRFDAERKRLEQETAEMRSRMKKTLEQRAEADRFNFLTTLLPVLDNLNLAIEASERDSSFDHLLAGVKGTERSFRQALLNVGVEPIAAVGELFDPEIHEAVDIVIADPKDEGKILGEYSKGYTFKGRLLRPARVQVGSSAGTGTAAE